MLSRRRRRHCRRHHRCRRRHHLRRRRRRHRHCRHHHRRRRHHRCGRRLCHRHRRRRRHCQRLASDDFSIQDQMRVEILFLPFLKAASHENQQLKAFSQRREINFEADERIDSE